MILSNLFLSTVIFIAWLSVIIAFLFLIYIRFREKQVKAVLKDFETRLDRSKFDATFFTENILPKLLEMHNPFSLKKPIIENYFSQYFVDKYLIKKTKNTLVNTPVD